MKVCVKRIISSLMVISMVSGISACKKDNGRAILNAAETLGIAVTKRDTRGIESLSAGSVDDLVALISFSSSSSDDDLKIKQKIASTLTYQVDADSLDINDGTVDIEFSYVDYEVVLSGDTIFQSMEELEEAMDLCEDRIDSDITFEFEVEDDKVFFTNLDEISELFPYSTEEFDITVDYPSMVGGITFFGEGYDEGANEYTDVYSISCSMEVLPEYQYIPWQYSYTIDRDGTNVTTSAIVSWNDQGTLDVNLNSVTRLAEGTYTVTFYSVDSQVLGSAEVYVRDTVEVSYNPAQPIIPDSENPTIDTRVDFICPADSSIQLPDTDIMVSLPDGVVCQDQDAFMNSGCPFTEYADSTLFFATDGSVSVVAFKVPFADYYTLEAETYQRDIADSIDDTRGDTEFTSISVWNMEIDGRPCDAIDVVGLTEDQEIRYDLFLVGDGDTSYIVVFYYVDEFSRVEELISQFSLV
ncbi:hypothetical protein SAMN06296952_0214 [Oscillospiraceae bacterium]|nr:hypothetical protein SAMN06296952_0214 [Oscillospiraceae bacterium]